MSKSSPSSRRSSLASCAEATKPPQPAARASPPRRNTCGYVAGDADLLQVGTPTGWSRRSRPGPSAWWPIALAASAAALSILLPPEAWTVNMATPSFEAERRRPDGVGDVVELQVQKHFTAGRGEIADDPGPFGREELLAYFVGGDRFAEGLDGLASLRGAGDIQRHDEPISDSASAHSLTQLMRALNRAAVP